MKELKDYCKKQKSIYEYFGYDGINLPIEDRCDHYWGSGDNEITFKYIKDPIDEEYTHGYYKKIYVGKNYTMFIMTTELDGYKNEHISIFNNDHCEDYGDDRCSDCSEIISELDRRRGNCWSCGSDFINLKV